MAPVECIRCNYKTTVRVPDDPSTEYRCPLEGCGGRLAADLSAYRAQEAT